MMGPPVVDEASGEAASNDASRGGPPFPDEELAPVVFVVPVELLEVEIELAPLPVDPGALVRASRPASRIGLPVALPVPFAPVLAVTPVPPVAVLVTLLLPPPSVVLLAVSPPTPEPLELVGFPPSDPGTPSPVSPVAPFPAVSPALASFLPPADDELPQPMSARPDANPQTVIVSANGTVSGGIDDFSTCQGYHARHPSGSTTQDQFDARMLRCS
jgi:hypothetical protein